MKNPTTHEADPTKLEVLAAERMGERTEKSALQSICRQRRSLRCLREAPI